MLFVLFRKWARRAVAVILPTLDSVAVRPRQRTEGSGWVGFVKLDRIGDFVIWLPVAAALTRHYRQQGMRTYLVANQAWAELAVACAYWDEIIPIDPVRAEWDVPYRWKIFRAAATHNTEILLYPSFSREFLVGDAICHAIAAREKVAYAGDTINAIPAHLVRGNRWYTKLIAPNPDAVHESDINRHFATEVGVMMHPQDRSKLPVSIPSSSNIPSSPYAVLAPGAAVTRKMWPVDNFGLAALHLVSRHGFNIVLTGSAGERQITSRIAAVLSGNCMDLSGSIDLPELIYIIQHSELVLTNDSATAHIAAALDVPCVSIAGGGHLGRFLPYPDKYVGKLVVANVSMACYGCKWNCVYEIADGEPFPCVAIVDVPRVLELIDRALE
jgi:ADP-heptose:LPS heptosyltransferase